MRLAVCVWYHYFCFCQLYEIIFKNSCVVTVKNANGFKSVIYFFFGVWRETSEVMWNLLCLGSSLS